MYKKESRRKARAVRANLDQNYGACRNAGPFDGVILDDNAAIAVYHD
jgi:hypothetical protein